MATHALDDLQKQIDALKKQHDELLAKERAEAIEDINVKIKTFKLRAQDLHFDTSHRVEVKRAKSVAPTVPKYQQGTATWSGRGRKPGWVEAHLAQGGELEDLRIPA